MNSPPRRLPPGWLTFVLAKPADLSAATPEDGPGFLRMRTPVSVGAAA